LIVKPHLPLFPTAPKYVTNPIPPYKNMCFEATIIQETKMEVYVDKHHIRLRHLYVMPLASTFLDEESMNDCIRKAMEWCEGLPSHDATYVKKMEMSESIGVTLKDGVWCGTSDTMLVAEVVWGLNNACVFIRTLYPC
jgi:hypothetical protein